MNDMNDMNEKLSYEGFCEFANQQLGIRMIDHNNAWNNCAVGDYVSHVTGNRDCLECNMFANNEIFHNNPKLYAALNSQYPRTYGELTKML